MNVEKITKTLLHISKEVRLRIHVNFTERDWHTKSKKLRKFHTIYSYGNKNYVSMDFMTYMTLEIKDDSEWTPDKSIMINQRNIYHIIHGLTKIIENIYKQDTFSIEDNKTIIFKDIAMERTVRLYNIGGFQSMVIVPSVVYEEQEDSEYEGAVIFLNDSSNSFTATIGLLETLLYTIKKVDLFSYGYMMIDFYFNNIVEHIGPSFAGEEVSDYIRSSRSNRFEERHKAATNDVTKSTLKKPGVTDKDFFGI